MSDCMSFPKTVEEFMDFYKVVDSKGIYMSKGAELVPVFRMEQWFEHQTDRMKFVQEAVNTLMNTSKTNGIKDKCFRNAARFVQNAIDGEPQDFERIPDEPQRTGRRMDLIDRQRLLVEARKLNSAITGRDKPFPVAEAFMEVINRQPTIEPEPHWIPCSERLPDEDGDYLVTFQLIYTFPVEVCAFFDGRWDKCGYDRVLAWMPLPEAYREGEG